MVVPGTVGHPADLPGKPGEAVTVGILHRQHDEAALVEIDGDPEGDTTMELGGTSFGVERAVDDRKCAQRINSGS